MRTASGWAARFGAAPGSRRMNVMRPVRYRIGEDPLVRELHENGGVAEVRDPARSDLHRRPGLVIWTPSCAVDPTIGDVAYGA